ncbi:MAG: hypothetical protein DMD26_16120 [Gemmatimonadetes bacterium]|nr:MAG: hypothetical protein DMD26_16120 [Gemmatimonadota bacterium]
MYIALLFLVILASDVWKALWFATPSGGKQFGIGVGTLVLAANVVFLSFYTLGCHSFRHIVGGFHDELSKHRVEQVAYDCASCLNRWHMRWAWTSLIGVAFADLYVRMCAMGMWHDWRIV